MTGRSSYQKMRERCDVCGTQQWYAENGLRYCRRGHQLQGFATTDVGEDGYNMTGRVTKRKKEKRKREALKLGGPAGKKLYLQALQHVLRLQVDWLRTTGLKLEEREGTMYEGVIKELWGMVCTVPGVMDNDETGEQIEDSGTDAVASGSEPETSDAESRSSVWLGKGARMKLPGLTHTLAICYIGCIILKQPVTTADFHGWAQRGELEFLAALHRVPPNVKARLPAKYHRTLQVRDHIKPGTLLCTVQGLVVALNVHFELRLPTLNYAQILVHYVLELTLPVEVYLMVKCLIEVLRLDFEFPDEKNRRIQTMENPETLLITTVVVATKLLHPLDGIDRPPVTDDDPRAKQIDWIEWENVRSKKREGSISVGGLERGTEHQTTANEALLFDDDKTDDFMDWYERMWVGNDDEPKTPATIRRAFQDENQQPRERAGPDQSRDDTTTAIQQRYRTMKSTMRSVETQPDPAAVDGAGVRKRLQRDYCPVWRTEDKLPHAARVLYQAAADLAVIRLKTLVTAAAQVERRLEIWSAQREGKRKEAYDPDPKGKGKAVA